MATAVEVCPHYERHCNLVCPTCSEAAPCRLCHAETASHQLNRFAVTTLECRQCGHKQPKAEECTECGVRFGKYACLFCCLFDDVERGQYHCEGCRLCRVGGRENFKHCDQCGYCMSHDSYEDHKCLVDIASKPCPVCLDDIHSSRTTPKVLKCRHMMHQNCYTDMIDKGIFACPVCGKSTLDMSKEWRRLDRLVRETPMPSCYRGVYCQVTCKDCNKECITPFHIDALKCKLCGSYNTARSGHSLLKKKDEASSDNDAATPRSSAAGGGGRSSSNAAAAANPSNNRQRNGSPGSVLFDIIQNFNSPARSRSLSPSPSNPPTASSATAAASGDLLSAASSSSQSVEMLAPPTNQEANQHSAMDESWMSVDENVPEPVPAKEELHLYETVDVMELEEGDDAPPEGGVMVLLDDLLHQLNSDINDDALDDLNDFSSVASSTSDEVQDFRQLPEVLSVEIDGRVARLEEAEASDWETDDEDEQERQSDTEEQFDTAESE